MTLLEVLICIFVMGMGILAIARLMTHNIETIARVHNQTTATTLAREWLEMLNNVRDTNILLWYEWNCAQRSTQEEIDAMTGAESLCKSFFWTGDATEYNYTIDGWLHPETSQIIMKKIQDADLFSGARLYLSGISINWVSISWYTHSISPTASPFARYIQFSWLSWLDNNSPILPSDIQVVRSIVLYNYQGKTGQVMLESFIANKG